MEVITKCRLRPSGKFFLYMKIWPVVFALLSQPVALALVPTCYFSHEAPQSVRLDTEPDLVLVQGCISQGSASSSRSTESALHLISSSWEGIKTDSSSPFLLLFFSDQGRIQSFLQ